MEKDRRKATRKNGWRGTLEERFWRMVTKTENCWLWTGSTVPGVSGGYGMIAAGEGRKIFRVHRVSWEIHFGPIPSGMFVLHKCDTRHCVRPDHLFLGTNDDNMKDMAKKGRADRTKKQKGEAAHMSKLTADQVREIRNLAGVENQYVTAARMGVKQPNISAIVRGKTWRSLL